MKIENNLKASENLLFFYYLTKSPKNILKIKTHYVIHLRERGLWHIIGLI